MVNRFVVVCVVVLIMGTVRVVPTNNVPVLRLLLFTVPNMDVVITLRLEIVEFVAV